MKHFGLIGFPLEHSFSKGYYDKKFQEEKLDADYQVFPLESEEALAQFVKQNTLDGYNVTIPYKQKIIPLLDDCSEEAKQIGAVNCVRRINGKQVGYNTDVLGVEESLKQFVDLQPLPTLVFGTGGASKAVQYVLKKYHFPFMVIGRDRRFSDQVYEELTEAIIKQHLLFIQCTSVGMWPNVEECLPIPFQGISNHHYCLDLIYNPEETLFLKKAKLQGASTMNGMLMLTTQAEHNFLPF